MRARSDHKDNDFYVCKTDKSHTPLGPLKYDRIKRIIPGTAFCYLPVSIALSFSRWGGFLEVGDKANDV